MAELPGINGFDSGLSVRNDQVVDEGRHALFDLLARVATLYYLEDKTQNEIATELGLSRQKVQRLLRQARDQRIVEIHVHAAPVLHLEIERRIKTLFHVDAVIAPSDPDLERRRHSVARAAASYLERCLFPGATIAVGLGRNAGSVAAFLRLAQRTDCTFVSAMGGSPHMGLAINPNDIANNLAQRLGGRALALYAPTFVESSEVRASLLAHETIQQTLDVARQADIALMGIGTPTDDSILVKVGCLSLAEVHRLRDMGAVGEILGNYFDQYGCSLMSDLNGRLIGLTMEELQRIPRVIAIASEVEKAQAVLGALRSSAVRVLVTECQVALELLRAAGVTDLPEERELLGLEHVDSLAEHAERMNHV